MKSRFQYVLVGVGITLLAIVAVLVIGFKPTQAGDASNTAISTNSAEITQVQLPVNNLSINETQKNENAQLFAERNRLVADWRASVAGQNGWLYMKVLYDRELDGGGVLPNGVPIPQDYISEQWYKLSDGSSVTQMVSFMWDLEGNLVQVATYRDGYWRNFSDNSKVAGTLLDWPQDDRFIAGNVFYNKITREDISSAETATTVFTYQYGHPAISFDEAGLEDIAITGGIIRETIDAATGQVMTVSTTHFLADGSEIFADEYTYLLVEVIDNLPTNVADYLMKEVDNDNQ
ncbi:hypothetical protein MNBD_CHLOROFLEXI01-4054 [hydrothermal vent metagenome]|uniref:Uncharacterized protein n=1 Tax=hydrothermal vent metagenome TaxID=652676 RepID=A0A3B0VH51_9ZZZZ